MEPISGLQLLTGAQGAAANTQRLDKTQPVKPVERSPETSLLEARQAEEKLSKEIDVEKLRELVEQSNQAMEVQNKRLLFSIHEETGFQMVQVFDRDSEELIRQFPPDQYLSVAEQIQQMMPDESPTLSFEEQA